MSNVVTAQIHIAVPPQTVWDYVMDAHATEEWVTIVREVRHVDEGPLREGFEMEQTMCLRGVKFKVHWRLEAVEPPHFARWEGKGPARSRAVIEDRLTSQDGGTCFDYANQFKAPLGPLGNVASKALVGGIPEREANASLAQLKAILESR